jgi:hypothetical protein
VQSRLRLISGKLVDVLNLGPGDVLAYDIAWALAQTNRYNGHTPVQWSVLSHVGLAYLLASSECQQQGRAMNPYDALGLLLHDAAEAYIGEMVGPLKNTEYMENYRQLEKRVLTAILFRFGINPNADPYPIDWEFVKRYDKQAAHVEYYHFHPELRGTEGMIPPVYPLNRYPKLALAKPEQFLSVLKPMAINVGAENVGALFALPEKLHPYIQTHQEESEAQETSREGDDQLPAPPDLSSVENLHI